MNTTVKRIVAACCLIGILLIAINYSLVDAFALSLCIGGFVWMLFDRRIENLKTQVAILRRGETDIQESVEGLYRGEALSQESVEVLNQRIDTLHESVDSLYETLDKLQRRVEYHSEWCQSLQEMIGAQRRTGE